MLLKEDHLAARGVRTTDCSRGLDGVKATAAARRATEAVDAPLRHVLPNSPLLAWSIQPQSERITYGGRATLG